MTAYDISGEISPDEFILQVKKQNQIDRFVDKFDSLSPALSVVGWVVDYQKDQLAAKRHKEIINNLNLITTILNRIAEDLRDVINAEVKGAIKILYTVTHPDTDSNGAQDSWRLCVTPWELLTDQFITLSQRQNQELAYKYLEYICIMAPLMEAAHLKGWGERAAENYYQTAVELLTSNHWNGKPDTYTRPIGPIVGSGHRHHDGNFWKWYGNPLSFSRYLIEYHHPVFYFILKDYIRNIHGTGHQIVPPHTNTHSIQYHKVCFQTDERRGDEWVPRDQCWYTHYGKPYANMSEAINAVDTELAFIDRATVRDGRLMYLREIHKVFDYLRRR